MINPARMLKPKRKEARFTQQEIADFLGVSRPSYANLEDGRKPLPLDGIGRLKVTLRDKLKVNPETTQLIANWHLWHYLPRELRPLLEDVLDLLEEQQAAVKLSKQAIHALHLRIRALESAKATSSTHLPDAMSSRLLHGWVRLGIGQALDRPSS